MTRGRKGGHIAPHALDPTPGPARVLSVALPADLFARLDKRAGGVRGFRALHVREAIRRYLDAVEAE